MLDKFEASKWFRIVRAFLFAAVTFALTEDIAAEAQKAAGQEVTHFDIPPVFITGLAGIAAFLKGGDKNV